MKTEKHELVNAAGKLQPYRRGKETFDVQNTIGYEKYPQEIEEMIHLIYKSGLEPKEEQSESGRYCFLDYPELAKQLGTDQYLTMLALEAVKADIIPGR